MVIEKDRSGYHQNEGSKIIEKTDFFLYYLNLYSDMSVCFTCIILKKGKEEIG